MERLNKFKALKFNENVDALIEEMVKEVLSDKNLCDELHKININTRGELKRNISIIHAYKEEKDYCKKCPGFDKCDKRRPHYQTVLNYNGKFFNNYLTPCHLKIEDEKKDRLYLTRDFPKEWRDVSFDDLAPKPLLKAKKDAISRFINSQNNSRNWIYIYGNHLSGKSYLATYMINTATTLGKTCAFLDFPNQLKRMSDLSYAYKEEAFELLKKYQEADVLVLDNFGDEYKNDYIRDNFTLPLLNERARNSRMTIFTSTFSYNEIRDMYITSLAGKAKAKQIENLLKEYCEEPFDISTLIYQGS